MEIASVILAAGKGTRMKSDLPKVLHKLNGKPMVKYVVELAEKIGSNNTILVVGHKKEMVMDIVGPQYKYVDQIEMLGSGHAVRVTEEALKNHEGLVLVFCGDVPLISKESIETLIDKHLSVNASATVLTAIVPDSTGYGRIIKDSEGHLDKIVEEKDASEVERLVKEINSGTFCFDKSLLFDALKEVKSENAQNEYYLTDVIKILKEKGCRVTAQPVLDWREIIGVNTIEALNELEGMLNEAR